MPPRRTRSTILHADLDAFYASVEQLDKPSLRGKPVIVGGVGARGVVATASYEARAFGVHSAMSTVEARARCPKAAFLVPRFEAYRAASEVVMALLRELSPLVEPLSLDEAYVDLEAGGHVDVSDDAVRALASSLKERVHAVTGLRVSVGAGSSKLVAKIASDLDKPDGLRVVSADAESEVLRPLPVTRLPGVGPATAARLRGIGVRTVADLADLGEPDAVAALGATHGRGLWLLAHGLDGRPVIAERESKSISVEDTFEHDIADVGRLQVILDAMSRRVVARLRRARLSGRTVVVKVRHHDFATATRSATLPSPTDDVRTVQRLARQLLGDIDVSGGIRLLGVGISALAEWTQDDLFGAGRLDAVAHGKADDNADGEPHDARHGEADDTLHDAPHGKADDKPTDAPTAIEREPQVPAARGFPPGSDVTHTAFGRGWVQGSGSGWVTVRFETRTSDKGPVRSFRFSDHNLTPVPPDTSWSVAATVRRMDVTDATIELDTIDGPLGLYEARPAGARGAVVVVQEAFGVNHHIQDVARRFAGEGYYAVSPHLFHRDGVNELPYGDFDVVKPHMANLTDKGIHTDIEATVEHLAGLGFSLASTAIVGFCMGGSVVVVEASRHAFGAAVTFYGGGVVEGRFGYRPLAEVAPDLKSPWLGLFGDKDASIPPEQVELLREEAKKAPVPTSVVRYAEGGHGFHCDARPANYHEESAKDAWAKTVDWLARFLTPHS